MGVSMRGPMIVLGAIAALGCTRDDAALAQEIPAGKVSSLAPVTSATASAAREVPDAPAPDAPLVELGGLTKLPGALAAERSLGVLDWLVRVRAEPREGAKVLGYLRAGSRVPVRDGSASPGDGCNAGWRAILPAGWVCMDAMTDDSHHEVLEAITRPPDFAHRLPYMYGVVTRGGPVYARIPTAEQLEDHEPNLDKHLQKWIADEVSGARYGLDVWLRYTTGRAVPSAIDALQAKVTDDDLPPFLLGGRRVPALSKMVSGASKDAVKVDQVDRRQGRSFIHSLLHQGRRYNVTPDLVVIPADRFRPIRGSSFHGWQVDKELSFPFALIRRQGGHKYRWEGDRMVEAEDLAWRSAHILTGKQRFYRDVLHYETREGFWIDDRHASRVDPAKRWPKWAKQGEKWIDINITKQVLVAYEGKKMVYATLVSTGEAGLEDPESSTATTRGIFRIHTKWAATTMDSDQLGEEFELRDVPYVQYFEEGYAIHGAYWHDMFGRPKSHGCINLAPEDARRLFFWTEPALPRGWHGVKKSLTGTIVFVHP
jgi:hypothetical protein